MNLYPVYAGNEQLGTTGEPAPAYREYLRQFLETFRPQLLSYDHYHFGVKGDSDKGYFLNLAEIRQAASPTHALVVNLDYRTYSRFQPN